MPAISEEDLAKLRTFDLDDLMKRFRELLAEQTERHDGGNRWIGTGGTSPFGHGGQHPSGIRIGGPGGGRSAVQIADSRRFRNLRSDRILDTRQIGLALPTMVLYEISIISVRMIERKRGDFEEEVDDEDEEDDDEEKEQETSPGDETA